MTVCLFGHRILQNPVHVERALCEVVPDLLAAQEYVEFLIGRDGDFDLLAASVIRSEIKQKGCGRAELNLVLPFPRAEVQKDAAAFEAYYDHIEICDAARIAHYKAAFWVRNREMIHRSDLVIVALEHEGGGTARAAAYATKHGIPVINLIE